MMFQMMFVEVKQSPKNLSLVVLAKGDADDKTKCMILIGVAFQNIRPVFEASQVSAQPGASHEKGQYGILRRIPYTMIRAKQAHGIHVL